MGFITIKPLFGIIFFYFFKASIIQIHEWYLAGKRGDLAWRFVSLPEGTVGIVYLTVLGTRWWLQRPSYIYPHLEDHPI